MAEKVSVVIPTKNRIDVTLRCLSSVTSQTLSPFEIIVVDDGSTDDTSKKIKSRFPEVKIIRNNISKGGAVARNQGADLATGDFIAFLDSDDEWLPNHLKNKIGLMRARKSEGAFGRFYLKKGQVELCDSFPLDHESNGNIGNSILSFKRFDARTSTFVFRKEAFMKVKFDENLKKHQDWDLAINFDNEFNLTLDREPSVRIYVEQQEKRMSQKLHHPSSFYFIRKNADLLYSNSIFMFCVKQIMRSQLANESQKIIDNYLSVASTYYPDFIWQNKFLYKLLRKRIVNLGSIYRIVSQIKA